MPITFSIVIPIKDEAQNIQDLIHEIESVMQDLNRDWECICIDDGSTDNSLEILKHMQKEKDFLKLIVFSENYGQSSAFDAGFKKAQGEFVITLDGDRQNDPKDIPKLFALMEYCDLACGWRINRQDSWTKKLTSKLANKLRSRIVKDNIHDTGCSLKIYRRSCLSQIKLYDGMHRFLPALFAIEGFRVKELPVNHREREKGTSKYGFSNRLIRPICDLLAVTWMRRRNLNYRVSQDS